MKNTLLVEGNDDLHAVAALLEHYGLGNTKNAETYKPVKIEACKGFTVVLEFLGTGFKSVNNLGVIVDADDSLNEQWNKIRAILLNKELGNVPVEFPKTGLIIDNTQEDRKRVGIWIMPNNNLNGNLETFAKTMLPDDKGLFNYAQEVVTEAKTKGADYKKQYTEKAEIYTWLAWQEEPAQSIGRAITKSLLEPKNSQYANDFIKWYKDLFCL
ncbi:MAG: DUF3226 domain-containing protein [Pseudomonadota bacterium]